MTLLEKAAENHNIVKFNIIGNTVKVSLLTRPYYFSDCNYPTIYALIPIIHSAEAWRT